MKIAITGGTGFVGSHLAERLAAGGHEAVILARRPRTEDLLRLPGVHFVRGDVADPAALERAFAGVEAVAHCAGINREIGAQTYARVHVEATEHVVRACARAGVRRLALLSFLRARPGCGSPYHESKWAAEEVVRRSGLDWTVVKAGVIYGRGDHMLDHLSRALHTLPVFATVGFRERPVRPLAVGDLARLLEAALVGGRLARRTLAVTGPEELALSECVRRVAAVLDREPVFLRLPVAAHRVLAWLLERAMVVPLVSLAQVRILAEGIVEAWPPPGGAPAAAGVVVEDPPDDLRPATGFSAESIRAGLPPPGGFGWSDLRPCAWIAASRSTA